MRVWIIAVLCMMSFFSCKKDEVISNNENECNLQIVDSVPEVVVENKFYPLSVGSYWVYEFDTHLYNGTIIDNDQIDTVKIIGDSIINGDLYYIFKSGFPYDNTYLQRNNNGNIVSGTNALICPPDSTFISSANAHYSLMGTDTVHHFWESFSGYVMVNTPFGNYSCIQKLTYHNYWPNFGVGLVIDTSYYSSIGQIQRSFSYSAGSRNVGLLVDYHIE